MGVSSGGVLFSSCICRELYDRAVTLSLVLVLLLYYCCTSFIPVLCPLVAKLYSDGHLQRWQPTRLLESSHGMSDSFDLPLSLVIVFLCKRSLGFRHTATCLSSRLHIEVGHGSLWIGCVHCTRNARQASTRVQKHTSQYSSTR